MTRLKMVFLIFLSIFCMSAFGSNMEFSFEEGKSLGENQNKGLFADLKDINPRRLVPGFVTDNPKEANYKIEDIKSLGREQDAKDPNAKLVRKGNDAKKESGINNQTDFIKKANPIIKDSSDVSASSGSFCSGGDCTDTSYEKSKDFKKAISALSTVPAAGKELEGKKKCRMVVHLNPFRLERVCKTVYYIFVGEGMKCRDFMLEWSNCCQDTGWGRDMGLAGCNSEERHLGKDKEAGLCHYVGKYCSKKYDVGIVHGCARYSKTYCCFKSKLGRIIQEQGRKQLRKGWGDKKEPDCSGLTLEQLQKVDFSKINFTEYYEDLDKRLKKPDTKRTQDDFAKEIDKKRKEAEKKQRENNK